MARGVEGFITIDTSVAEQPLLPTIAVAGHEKVENVTNIVLDHRRAAQLALHHLGNLDINASPSFAARQKAQDSAAALGSHPGSCPRNLKSRSIPNWSSSSKVSTPRPNLAIRTANSFSNARFPSPRSSPTTIFLQLVRCAPSRKLVSTFLAIFQSWDSTISHWRHSPSRRSRQCVSLLLKMGRIAAQTLLDRIEERASFCFEIAIEPELVVRKSHRFTEMHIIGATRTQGRFSRVLFS